MTDDKIIKPSIKSISPTSGKAGTTMVISGAGFVDGNNVHGVFFGDVPALSWNVDDNNTISNVTVPSNFEHGDTAPLTGSVSVTVRTEGGLENFGGEPQTSNAVTFSFA